MNRLARRFFLTMRERILLHLLSIHKYNQDADAPRASAQDGIALAIEVGRNNVPKVMNVLIAEGEVEVSSRHVKGTPSTRKVYFLTQKGFSEALELKREVETTRVTVIDMKGERTEDELGRLQLYLPKQFSLLELGLGVDRGVFDCQAFHEGKVKEERRFVDYTDRKPAVRTFFGRRRELAELGSFLESEAKMMVIQGIAGIGKTTLLARFAQERKDQAHIFWFKVHEWVDAKALLRPLGEFLSQVGRKGLEWYLAQAGSVNVNEVCHVMESELKDSNTIWIIDDVQKAGKEVSALLSALLETIVSVPGVKVICSSREVPSFYTRSWVHRGVVRELVIEGLDRESSLSLMSERSLSAEHFEEIFRVTRGHPLFMELVEDPKLALGKNVRVFLEQEVYSKLDLSERRILEIASIFRYPVPTDSFFIMEEEAGKDGRQLAKDRGYGDYMVDYDTIDALLRKSLLKETIGGLVGMHDVLRDFFYNRLPPRQRLSLHRAASNYYLLDSSASSHVEALYHGMLANECRASVRIAAGRGRDIISKGYANQLAPLLEDLTSRCPGIEGAELLEILLLQAEIMDLRGDWDRAMERYARIDAQSSPARDRRLKAEVNRRMGVIHLRRYSYEPALAYLEEAKTLAESLQDEQTLAGILYDIGGVLERKGESKKALECFQTSESHAAMAGDDMGRGRALYGMGRAYGQLHDMEMAISRKRAALDVLERTGSVMDIAKVRASLGSDLLNEGFREEAVASLERAVELASGIGDLNTLGYALINLSGGYIEVGNLEKAEVFLDQAAVIAQRLDERFLIAVSLLHRGYILHKKGDWEWAKERYRSALDALRQLNAPTRLSYWLYEVAKVYVENADYLGASALLEDARQLAVKHGQEHLLQRVEQLLREINPAADGTQKKKKTEG